MHYRYLLIAALFFTMIACHRQLTIPSADPVSATQTIQPFSISDTDSTIAYSNLRFVNEVKDFYRARHHQPFWVGETRLSPRADSIMFMIKESRRYGLLPQSYHARELWPLTQKLFDKTARIRMDILLTDAFFSMANDLKVGRIQGRAVRDSLQTRLLTDSLDASDIRRVLLFQEPTYPEYHALKRALNMLLDSMDNDTRDGLMQGNDNDALESHRIVQRIEINLDRWRSETAELTGTYVWINVPAYMFYVVEYPRVLMESRIIVGAPRTPTPTFSSSIECFTVFPYWYMPRKIAVQEYLPVIKKDTTFITRNNFDVLDRNGKIQDHTTIDWKKYNANNFPFTLRQREGKENSLGIVKFVFDNPYAVYVHDTNAKRLFRHKNRAYSHGCIRLEKAVEFAYYLIGGRRSTISTQALDRYLNGEKRTTISLLQPVPIHIRYFTCEIRDGKLLSYPDIYKKDESIIKALYHDALF